MNRVMTQEDVSGEALMAMALQGLGMDYTHVHADSGESLWHVPVGSPNNTILTVFVGPFTAGITCLVGDVTGGQAQRPLDLLRLNANLTLAKIALRDNHLFVQAEIPTEQITDRSLKLAITSVLDALKRAQALFPLNAIYGTVA
jgi:hypothetical protein